MAATPGYAPAMSQHKRFVITPWVASVKTHIPSPTQINAKIVFTAALVIQCMLHYKEYNKFAL